MHGTGTPLGDPVEVAAGLAALRPASMHQSGQAPQRLALVASKSQAGHCEPAAGLVGLAAAVAAISNAAMAPVLHLRNLNPYVEAAMDGHGNASVARTDSGWAVSQRLPPACSVSSFAFQVTSTLFIFCVSVPCSYPGLEDHIGFAWSLSIAARGPDACILSTSQIANLMHHNRIKRQCFQPHMLTP